MNILRDKLPIVLHTELIKTMYIVRRAPHKAKFFDNSKGKIGRQCFGNNLHFMAAINDDWLTKGFSDDGLEPL